MSDLTNESTDQEAWTGIAALPKRVWGFSKSSKETWSLADPEVFSRLLAPIGNDFVPHLGTLIEAAQTGLLNCRNVYKDVVSGWINPNPLVGLNHFTVPVARSLSHLKQWRDLPLPDCFGMI